MVHELIGSLGASPDILEFFLSFCQKTVAVEEGFSSAPLVKCNGDILGTFPTHVLYATQRKVPSNRLATEIAYIFKYAFQKTTEDEATSWVIRQTGVYQQYNRSTNASTWIFLHPTRDCRFQQRLNNALTSPSQYEKLQQHPLLLHNILFTTYFPNWRDYLAYCQSRVLPIVSNTPGLGIDLNTNRQIP